MDLDECVNCGAGLLTVSDICPQCGWLKNKPIELNEIEEEGIESESSTEEAIEESTEEDIEESTEEDIEESTEEDIEESTEPTETEIKNKIPRPVGIRLLGFFLISYGIFLVVFGIIFGLAVILLVLPNALFSIDPATMSSIEMIIGLNGVVGSPSASEIYGMLKSSGIINIEMIMDVLTETMVIAIIEISLGIFAVMVARGLLKGKKWARVVTIGTAIISIPLVVLFVENLDNLILLGMAAFDGIVLYYMFKPKVRAYFSQTSIKKSDKNSKQKAT